MYHQYNVNLEYNIIWNYTYYLQNLKPRYAKHPIMHYGQYYTNADGNDSFSSEVSRASIGGGC